MKNQVDRATGSMMDGAVEFVTEDPNGEVMYGIFYPDEKPSEDAEQTFTLKFTESSWDLLETDTEFPLFVKLPE